MPRRISNNTRQWMWATLADNRTPMVLKLGSPFQIVSTAIAEKPSDYHAIQRHYDRVVDGCLDRGFPPETVCLVLKSLVNNGYMLDPNSTTLNRWHRHPGIRRKVANLGRPGFRVAYRAFQKRLTPDTRL